MSGITKPSEPSSLLLCECSPPMHEIFNRELKVTFTILITVKGQVPEQSRVVSIRFNNCEANATKS